MSLKLKPVYENMVNGFVKEYIKHSDLSKTEYNSLLDTKIEIDSMVEGIKKITVDQEMNSDHKYIVINEEIAKVEKKMKRVYELTSLKSEREVKLAKDRDILLSTCMDSDTSIKEKDLVEYIDNKIASET